MEIKVSCNAGYELTLDTIAGMVVGIPNSVNSLDVGYLHLGQWNYTDDEIAEIKRITIQYFAGCWSPWSQVGILTYKYVSRPWNPGEKEAAIDRILARSISTNNDPIEIMPSGEYRSEEEKTNALIACQQQDSIQELALTTSHKLSLGASFQRFFCAEENWLAEAESIKGESIYLA